MSRVVAAATTTTFSLVDALLFLLSCRYKMFPLLFFFFSRFLPSTYKPPSILLFFVNKMGSSETVKLYIHTNTGVSLIQIVPFSFKLLLVTKKS